MERRQSLSTFTLSDIEILQLVSVLSCGDNTQEITELLLSQILLGQIFQVSLGEWKLSSDIQLSFVAIDNNFVAKVASFAVDLDAIVKKLLEG
jgi:hypothetical protein